MRSKMVDGQFADEHLIQCRLALLMFPNSSEALVFVAFAIAVQYLFRINKAIQTLSSVHQTSRCQFGLWRCVVLDYPTTDAWLFRSVETYVRFETCTILSIVYSWPCCAIESFGRHMISAKVPGKRVLYVHRIHKIYNNNDMLNAQRAENWRVKRW